MRVLLHRIASDLDERATRFAMLLPLLKDSASATALEQDAARDLTHSLSMDNLPAVIRRTTYL